MTKKEIIKIDSKNPVDKFSNIFKKVEYVNLEEKYQLYFVAEKKLIYFVFQACQAQALHAFPHLHASYAYECDW